MLSYTVVDVFANGFCVCVFMFVCVHCGVHLILLWSSDMVAKIYLYSTASVPSPLNLRWTPLLLSASLFRYISLTLMVSLLAFFSIFKVNYSKVVSICLLEYAFDSVSAHICLYFWPNSFDLCYSENNNKKANSDSTAIETYKGVVWIFIFTSLMLIWNMSELLEPLDFPFW